MRFVLDANVIINASLAKNSVAFKTFERVLDIHTPLISESTFSELRITLFKSKFDRYFFPEDTRPGIL
jgi:predicted nucleic acid-binding protein